jgi:hypothetical protein
MADRLLQDRDAVIPEPNGHDDAQKRLELLNFHIVRYDGLRAATANRASILLSADTLLLAALGLLDTNGISEALKRDQALRVLSIIVTLGIVFLILGSVCLALNAIVIMAFKFKSDPKFRLGFKSSRDLYGAIPDRLLYNHSDTVRACRSAQDFKASLTLTYDRLLESALESASAELWAGIRQQHRRYDFLRKAILLFVISVFAYSVVAFLVLFPW